MRYHTSFYWQQESDPRTSIVLQNLICGKRKVPVMFACLCSVGDGMPGNAYFAERLTFWFQSCGRDLLLKKSENEEEIILSLQRTIIQTDGELRENAKYRGRDLTEAVSLAGVLCIADYYFLFWRGNIRIYLLNERFGKANITQITEDSEGLEWHLQLLSGKMEAHIGLLLSTKDFGKNIERGQMGECLDVRRLMMRCGRKKGSLQEAYVREQKRTNQETQEMERCMRELGRVSENNGGRHMGAVLLITE